MGCGSRATTFYEQGYSPCPWASNLYKENSLHSFESLLLCRLTILYSLQSNGRLWISISWYCLECDLSNVINHFDWKLSNIPFAFIRPLPMEVGLGLCVWPYFPFPVCSRLQKLWLVKPWVALCPDYPTVAIFFDSLIALWHIQKFQFSNTTTLATEAKYFPSLVPPYS